MNKLFLVDGAKGHTGTFLVKALLEDDSSCKIIATDLPPDSRKQLMTKEKVFGKDFSYMVEILDDPRVEFIPSDLTKPDTLEELFKDKNGNIRKYDVIYHPASFWDYFAPLDICRKINVEGTRNLLNLVISTQDLKRVRFIHWSTCGVYGEPKYEYDKKTKFVIPCDENTPWNPLEYYGISKTEQELVIKEFMEKNGLKATILRPSPVFGPYQMYGIYHLILLLRVLGHGIEPLLHPKKHRPAFPSVHVEDLALAAIFISKKEEAIGEIYNIVNDMVWMVDWLTYMNHLLGIKFISLPIWFPIYRIVGKFGAWLARIRDKKARKLGIRPILDKPMLEYLTKQFAYSNKKLKQLGYKFKYDTFSGFKQTINWYIQHGWLPTEQNKMEIY